MSGSMEFFWRDIQTVKGAVRAALALPHVDIGELREVERSHAYTEPTDHERAKADFDEKFLADIQREHGRMTIKRARAMRTEQWHAKPPSIHELFALPILSQVAM